MSRGLPEFYEPIASEPAGFNSYETVAKLPDSPWLPYQNDARAQYIKETQNNVAAFIDQAKRNIGLIPGEKKESLVSTKDTQTNQADQPTQTKPYLFRLDVTAEHLLIFLLIFVLIIDIVIRLCDNRPVIGGARYYDH